MIPAAKLPSRALLGNPDTPWHVSSGISEAIQLLPIDNTSGKHEITYNSPEWSFIQSYFELHPPTNRHIGRVYCIQNKNLRVRFEAHIQNLEIEAKQPAFKPKWDQNTDVDLRRKVNHRWEMMAAQYSPFIIKGENQEKKTYVDVKIFPLLHGTTVAKGASIGKTGFTSFGKHFFLSGQGSRGQSTDAGFFGSGLYFTNSFKYAAEIYSDGTVVFAWVAMRPPYHVVANCKYPGEPDDMRMLRGKGHFENYNAHYIPVVPVSPLNEKCSIYYPCTKDQEPLFDEFVVFQDAQTLPTFQIELEVTLLKGLSTHPTFKVLLDSIEKVLINRRMKNSKLLDFLQKKLTSLLSLDEKAFLDKENNHFYRKLGKLIRDTGEIEPSVEKYLICFCSGGVVVPEIERPAPITWKKVAIIGLCFFIVIMAIFGLPFFIPSRNLGREICMEDRCAYMSPQQYSLDHMSLPSKAEISYTQKVAQTWKNEIVIPDDLKRDSYFGFADWRQNLGEVGPAPCLRADIRTILNSPCPFWAGKKVKDTHVLRLVPATVNGKPLTFSCMKDLLEYPKSGARQVHGMQIFLNTEKEDRVSSSRWILITEEQIPNTWNLSSDDQKKYLKGINPLYEVSNALEVIVSSGAEYAFQKKTKHCLDIRCQIDQGGSVIIDTRGDAVVVSDDFHAISPGPHSGGIMASRRL